MNTTATTRGLRSTMLPLLLLAAGALALPAAAQTCSVYAGQARLNELRIGFSNKTHPRNQIEIFNSGNLADAVTRTWQLAIYSRDGSNGPAVRRGGYYLSSGFIANGQFLYNNGQRLFLRNRSGNPVDVALLDASGAFIDYIAVGATVQTVPACLGTPVVVGVTSNNNTAGNVSRATDGGTWPAAVKNTSVHTIGASNACTPGASDLRVGNSADFTTPVVNSTTVTYTVDVANVSCTNGISSIQLTDTAISTARFGSLTRSATQGTTALSGDNLVWSVGALAAGQAATLTISGKPLAVGTLVTTASITAPASGLVNTANDSDTETLNVTSANLVGFQASVDTVTEGTASPFSALIAVNVPSNRAITVNYTVSGTAGSGDTTLAASGSVTIPAGEDLASIAFTVNDDSVVEPAKTIVLNITGVTSTDALVQRNTEASTLTIELLDDDTGGPDHYEISLPASGINCLPSTVTVTACNTATAPCTSPATALAGTTATLAASAGTLGSTLLTFNAQGVASTTLSHPTAAQGAVVAVTLSGEQTPAVNGRLCCPDGVNCSAAASCSSTYAMAGLVIAASAAGPAATVPSQVAGTPSGTLFLRAVRSGTDTAACAAALTGPQSIDWAYQCQNPTTCSASNLMTLNAGTATAISRNDLGTLSSLSAVAMTFDTSGSAPFSFTYQDAGQVTLAARKSVNQALLSTTSNAFVARPATLALSAIRQTAAPALANPGAANATGARFVKAGEPFSATVTALTAGGLATPNFGREAAPEGVLLTRTLVQPAGGAAGTLGNATLAGGAFSGGVATATHLSYAEVGIITLTPALADGDYLGAGAVAGSPSGNIGRFVPDRFAVSGGTVLHRAGLSCTPASAFSYLGENFRLGWTLTALNAAGGTTANYTGSYARLDPAAAASWNLAGVAGSTVFSTAGGRLSLGSASGSFVGGVASGITLTAVALRADAPEGPFDAAFGIAPVDADGVALAGHDLDTDATPGADRTRVAGVALRFGRLRLANAIGPADRNLLVPARTQSWTGSTFETEPQDSCTRVPVNAMRFGNPRSTLTAADARAVGDITFAAGLGTLVLAPPAAGRSGTLDLALNLGSAGADASCLQPWTPGSGGVGVGVGANLPHLRGASCGSSYEQDPSARVTFGRQRGNDQVIYRRENY